LAHDQISVNSGCFKGAGARELAGALKELGVARVSFAGTVPDPEIVASVVRDGGLGLESVVHPFLYQQQLDAPDSVIVDEQEKLSRMIRLVVSLRGRSIFMSTGGRGALTWEEAAERFSAGIAPCVAEAESAGIALMIENTPQLYADLHIAHSLPDTILLAEMAGIGVCLDVFSCWMEAGIEESIARAMPRCQLIQVNDYVLGDRALPGRAVPGDGAIPLRRMFETALGCGYRGSFDLEISGPRIDAEGHLSAARRGVRYIDELLRSLGV
jgi:sugar phosphate isomerase/epimerase